MAIVANKALGSENIPNYSSATDRAYCSPNRSNAGEPNGSLTPQYLNEIVLDTTNNALWIAVGAANTDWVTLTTPA